eukprot:252238_1
MKLLTMVHVPSQLLISMIFVDTISGLCINSHPGHTIGYIVNHTNTDSSIRYLGSKSSVNDCQNSCHDFNYVCDKSSSDVFDNINGINPLFDNANCEITFPQGAAAAVSLTSDLIAKEYIIDAQITATSGVQIGIYFRSDQAGYGYFFVMKLRGDTTCKTGYHCGTNCENVLSNDVPPTTIDVGIMYNLSVHVHDRHFVTYFEGDTHFSTYSNPSDKFGSQWGKSYAGVFVWNGAGIIHSFKLTFPDASDNADERFCAAFLYDTSSNHCYGYYGTDYAHLESSLSSNSRYDSAIRYDSNTCPPTGPDPMPQPTVNPTSNPTLEPTTQPTQAPNPTFKPVDTTVTPTSRPSTGVLQCGTFSVGVYYANAQLLFETSMPFPGELILDASGSEFTVTQINAFGVLGLVGTDEDHNEIITLSVPAGDYMFVLMGEVQTSGIYHVNVRCISAKPTLSPTQLPTNAPSVLVTKGATALPTTALPTTARMIMTTEASSYVSVLVESTSKKHSIHQRKNNGTTLIDDLRIIGYVIVVLISCCLCCFVVFVYYKYCVLKKKYRRDTDQMAHFEMSDMSSVPQVIPDQGLIHATIPSNLDEDLVISWLTETVRLPQYAQLFVDQGYDSMRAVQRIQGKSELCALGVEVAGHQTLIEREIKEIQDIDFTFTDVVKKASPKQASPEPEVESKVEKESAETGGWRAEFTRNMVWEHNGLQRSGYGEPGAKLDTSSHSSDSDSDSLSGLYLKRADAKEIKIPGKKETWNKDMTIEGPSNHL